MATKKITPSYYEEKIKRSSTNNLLRALLALYEKNVDKEVIKSIALQINWNEESTRIIFERSGENKDSTRDILYQDLPEDILCDLICENMYQGSYSSGYVDPPYQLINCNKFKFLTQYLKSYNDFLKDKKEARYNSQIGLNSRVGNTFTAEFGSFIKSILENEQHYHSYKVENKTDAKNYIKNTYDFCNFIQDLTITSKDIEAEKNNKNNKNFYLDHDLALHEKALMLVSFGSTCLGISLASDYVKFENPLLEKLVNLPGNYFEDFLSLYSKFNENKDSSFLDEMDDSWGRSPSTLSSASTIAKAFISNICTNVDEKMFKTFVDFLVAKNTPESTEILEKVVQKVCSFQLTGSKYLLYGRRHLTYGYKEGLVKELKDNAHRINCSAKNLSYLNSNEHTKVLLKNELATIISQPETISSDVKKTKPQAYEDDAIMPILIKEYIVNDCSMSIEKVLSLCDVGEQIKVEQEILTPTQLAASLMIIKDVRKQLWIEKGFWDCIDPANSDRIKKNAQKCVDTKNNNYSLCSSYLDRIEQYKQFNIKINIAASSLIPSLAKNVTSKDLVVVKRFIEKFSLLPSLLTDEPEHLEYNKQPIYLSAELKEKIILQTILKTGEVLGIEKELKKSDVIIKI